ncbi:hypothetical protein HUK65_12525 [Rhodobacteraceae bacterium 2376]|uniref:DUF2059 domain-containing protein n=1 Tax=Rhabdonatronobacter sediminivivens TaxID=2743469 RepID=A0A7Z0I1C9_9RHOB|nr:hypothetical protein [Rhabdonatronobacter sediminivivens]NYS25817.1 hypothetical protein [Rhabdonatronobacter sediminivivens]
MGCIRGGSRATALTLALGFVLLLMAASMARSDERLDIEALSSAYRLPALFEAIALEGRDAADAISEEVLQGQGGASWRRAIDDLYDPDRMLERFLGVLHADLEDRAEVHLAAMEFALRPEGAAVITTELRVRVELRAEGAEQAMQAALEQARRNESADLAFVRERIRVNNLIEQNVSLGLNGSLAYFSGFMAAAPPGMGLSEGQIAAEVWGQEEEIRAETVDWLEGYLLRAYSTLSDEARAALMAHARSAEGDAFNTAMFRAYEVTFAELSEALGSAVGRALQMREL